ncbi:dynein light chain Tctex-type protein 2B isoform X5 [Dasypus novemcinctus]|uniref:dynein light chain Tctex-type protein 2B isoform X5 n=1 Tax=Dasypus novemcinctus TaxID=9361 RepID=UPI00265EC7DF|nr:dynein light chain Tctex-type protein 2B isoform X6 [Dasypus novemcinctus]
MASSAGVSFSVGDGVPETEKNAGESENTYTLRPVFQQRFRPSLVKDCIHAVLKEELASAVYSPEEMPQLTKRLSEHIKDKLKANYCELNTASGTQRGARGEEESLHGKLKVFLRCRAPSGLECLYKSSKWDLTDIKWWCK